MSLFNLSLGFTSLPNHHFCPDDFVKIDLPGAVCNQVWVGYVSLKMNRLELKFITPCYIGDVGEWAPFGVYI